MLCPHCNSPRHNLCAAGFRLEVDLTTLTDACSDFSAAHLNQSKLHLLGPQAPFSDSTLVVLPVFSDTGLGSYGAKLTADRLTALLKNHKLDIPSFQGEYGQTHLVVMAPDANPHGVRMNVLFIGIGPQYEGGYKSVCALVGTALESAVSGNYEHVVLALSDFDSTIVSGRQIGAFSRCRVAQAIVENQIDCVLKRITLIAQSEQITSLCQGIDISGPLCAACDHPFAGAIVLPRT
ncbi:MAG: hypothetical protein KGS72_08900 [Cyanobacteria bacterium REEB67]|nr:hypothetical protein [Cyanobacteria bacterium REEB67]